MAIINGNNLPNFLIGTNVADTINGFGSSDVLQGFAGNDILNGGLGADVMIGGAGNDIYIVDNAFDVVAEWGGGGIDTIRSSVSQNMSTLGRFDVENLTLVGGAAINGIGNGLANTMFGNNAANTLSGLSGNDRLFGGGGNDNLIGGFGVDVMAGGANDDIFRFTALTSSTGVLGADVITDFDDFGNDRIDVSTLFGPAMAYRHNLAFTAAGQVRINDILGPDVVVQVNTGGTLAADFSIRLTNTFLGAMSQFDFIL